MKIFKYRKIVNENCHLVIKLCYYIGIVKINELENAYAMNIRFYHPLIIVFSLLFYLYRIIIDIIKVLKNNAKIIYNDLIDNNDRNIIIKYKNEKSSS